MPMEEHKCKLCARAFINGRALWGHMKAHFSAFLLLSKPPDQTFSPLSASSSQEPEFEEVAEKEEDEEEAEDAMIYEPRHNPSKSSKLADPTVLDRGSQTESKGPTRRRSKRKRTSEDCEALNKPIFDDIPAEQEPASSLSDTSPEQNVAICLILLSRDTWVKKKDETEKPLIAIKTKKGEGKNKCKNCRKAFRSSRALRSHKKICLRNGRELKTGGNDRIFECPFCCKVFGSGQALGGHKRSHLMPSANNCAHVAKSGKTGMAFIDLNLPPPMEEEDYSVVSDA